VAWPLEDNTHHLPQQFTSDRHGFVIPMLTACGAEACALELGALGEHAHIRESVFADALGIGFVLCEEREVLR